MSIELAPQSMQPDQTVAPVEVILYTVAQAAKRFQVSERTIHRLIERGFLETVRIGSVLRIHGVTLDAFARQGTRKNYAGVEVETLDRSGVVVAQ